MTPSLLTLIGSRSALLQLSGTVSSSLVLKRINIMAVAYNLPRLWGRALSQPVLDGPVPLHPPAAVEQLSPSVGAGAKRRQGDTGLDTSPGTQEV